MNLLPILLNIGWKWKMGNFSHKKALKNITLGLLGLIIPGAFCFGWVYFWANISNNIAIQLVGVFSPGIIFMLALLYHTAGSDDF